MMESSPKYRHWGNFEAAYRLIQIAEKGDLLGDRKKKKLIMCAFVCDNENLYRDAEEYITYRALNNIFWKQQNGGYSDGYGQRKSYQL
jgi:hypothetical protein